MSRAHLLIVVAVALGAVGVALVLPRRSLRGRMLGALLAAVAAGLLLGQVPTVGQWTSQSILWILAALTLGSAVAAITLRNPVYCAIWFGMTLFGTAGLYLFQGAQFLAVATIVIYAGAILVTFLFVLMLAEPGGRASYDRVSWEALLSAAAGMLLVGMLSMAVGGVLAGEHAAPPPTTATAESRESGVLHEEHILRVGESLYSRHLVAIEAAAALLFAALIGAAVIVRRDQMLKPVWKRREVPPGYLPSSEPSSANGEADRGR